MDTITYFRSKSGKLYGLPFQGPIEALSAKIRRQQGLGSRYIRTLVVGSHNQYNQDITDRVRDCMRYQVRRLH